SIDHGQPLWGKHTLESLPVGQQWRLGNESATCWRTAVPLIQGDVLIAPGAYRVALSRRGEQSFTVDFASAAMAFGGNGTPGFAAKLVPGKHEVEKRLTLELRRTDGKGQKRTPAPPNCPRCCRSASARTAPTPSSPSRARANCSPRPASAS